MCFPTVSLSIWPWYSALGSMQLFVLLLFPVGDPASFGYDLGRWTRGSLTASHRNFPPPPNFPFVSLFTPLFHTVPPHFSNLGIRRFRLFRRCLFPFRVCVVTTTKSVCLHPLGTNRFGLKFPQSLPVGFPLFRCDGRPNRSQLCLTRASVSWGLFKILDFKLFDRLAVFTSPL